MKTLVAELSTISCSAERMRAMRERRKAGLRVIQLQVRDTEITGLISCRLLAAEDRDDRDAIATALGKLLDAVPPTEWWRLTTALK